MQRVRSTTIAKCLFILWQEGGGAKKDMGGGDEGVVCVWKSAKSGSNEYIRGANAPV